jgi:gliotoxin/aspirochlorine biosynthesis thioredoxin reductase
MMALAPKLYDALIIGAGPAGLSAALSLARLRRTTAVFTMRNKAGFRNRGVTEIHNILTRDGISPEEFRSIGAQQIEKYTLTDFVEADITMIEKVELDDGLRDGFRVEDANGSSWKGRKLLLAMGSVDIFPEIEGYRENWPQNM